MSETMKDKIWMWIVWKLPKTLIKWAAVRLMAHATTGQYGTCNTPSTTIIEALQRWETA